MLYQLPVLNTQLPPISIIQKQEPEKPKPIHYTIVANDSLEKIALDQHTTPQRLFSKNVDISDPNVIKTGEIVYIPAKNEVLVERPYPDTIKADVQGNRVGTAVTGGSSSSGNFVFGWCTWFADQQRPDIHATGNAADWIRYANSSVPRVGAVAVNTWAAGGLGHVGIVLDFNATQVLVRSMNFPVFGQVTDDWVDIGYWAGYIL